MNIMRDVRAVAALQANPYGCQAAFFCSNRTLFRRYVLTCGVFTRGGIAFGKRKEIFLAERIERDVF
jgi:hypothetical protein